MKLLFFFLSFFFRKIYKNFRLFLWGEKWRKKKFPKQRKHSICHVCFYLSTFYADDYVEKSILILGLSAANGINILMRSCHFMKNTFLQKQTFANSFIIIIALLYVTKVYFSSRLWNLFTSICDLFGLFSWYSSYTFFFQRQMFLNNFFEDKRARHEKKERRLSMTSHFVIS